MGRLGLRAGWDMPQFEIVRVNEIATDAAGSAHLLKFDSVHGVWSRDTAGVNGNMMIDGKVLAYSSNTAIGDTDWTDCDIVIEATGKHHKKPETLKVYFEQGVKKVIVAAPTDYLVVTGGYWTFTVTGAAIRMLVVLFVIVFAVNSALHSYLILAYSDQEKVSMSVGFYDMANAGGRLAGAVISGWAYQTQGLACCLWWSTAFAVAALFSFALPEVERTLPLVADADV
jgi:hypothetical protein